MTALRMQETIRRYNEELRRSQGVEVQSVAEYFEHFPTLEIDYTFYHPLLESKGSPSSNYHVLKSYRHHMKEENLVLLKAPQVVIARKLRRGPGVVAAAVYSVVKQRKVIQVS